MKYFAFHHFVLNSIPTMMPPKVDHKEEKVQATMALLRRKPHMKAAAAARQTRCSYERLRCQLKGVPPSSSCGGHNKKLGTVEDNVLKDYLFMCYNLGRSASVDNVVATGNSILRTEGRDEYI